MWITRKKRTDIGTIVLHWGLAAALVLCTFTGLRFAVDMPDTRYLKAIEPFLPVANIWKIHILAGVSVVALAAAYPIYLRRTGLARRIAPDRARIAALFRPGPARWGALNVLLYWLLFGCLLAQMTTGFLLHRGYGGDVVDAHLLVTWIIIAFVAAHIPAHFFAGGVAQLMRVIRPAPVPSPGGLDSGPGVAGARTLIVTAVVGLSVAAAIFSFDRASRDVLQVSRVDKALVQSLHDDLSDAFWRFTRPAYVRTNQGVNFGGSGSSMVELRAVHDGESIYFAFTWEDPTRSLKHAPLIKTADGWHALFSETPMQKHEASIARATKQQSDSNFEGMIAEDKFAIMLTNIEKPFGPGAFHPGPQPIQDKPPSSSGRGLHYTEDGSVVTLWLWRATGVNAGRCEVNRVGPALSPTNAEVRGLAPYKGGYAADPSEAIAIENFIPTLPRSWKVTVQPLRLPKEVAATRAAMDAIDLDPDHGEPAGARWWLDADDSIPYSAEADAMLPVGAIIPGIVAAPARAVTPSDVRCAARWNAGRWTLLTQRKLDTGHARDLVINRHTHLWVAAFDHTAANHTRHIRPIRLEIQP